MSFLSRWFGRKTPATIDTTSQESISVENVEFTQLEPSQLKPVSVVAQALDNQWVPRHLLSKLLNSRRAQGLQDIAGQLRAVVRAEYIRSLLMAEQVVVNRAFFTNTDVVRQDHLPGSPNREAFKGLLARGVIVPSLLYETAPNEMPKYGVNEAGFKSWQQVCQEVRTNCVRLSWNDEINKQKIGQMYLRFGAYAQALSRVAVEGDMARLLMDLGLPPEAQRDFRHRLGELSAWCAVQPDSIDRNRLYKEFVVAPGSDPVEGKYDPSKPYSGEIKQLLDLSYAINLPDALQRYALTPIDSLPRTSLQEVTVRFASPREGVTASDLKKLFQRDVFARVQTVLAGSEGFLKSLEHLSLSEVQTIRSTNEWQMYIAEVEQLLDQPLSFDTRVSTIFDKYVQLARIITRTSAVARETSFREHWSPVITLMIDIGGALITATMHPLGTDLSGQIAYNFLGNVTQDATQVVARLIIGGVSNLGAQAQLETSIDFMRARLDHAQTEWADLIDDIQGLHASSAQADQLERSQDVYDPNVNFAEETVA